MMDGSERPRAERAPSSGLIYASTALFPPRDVLLDIIRTAETANAAHGLSGMLCYSGTAYVQLLEGPEPALDRLWRNLLRDFRHRISWTVRLPPAPRRIPARLPMGYASERQVGEAGEPLFGPHPPDAAAAPRLAARLGTLAERIYPATCGVSGG